MDGPGRPSLYKPEFAEQAFELCLAGATNRDLADTFEVGHSTIDNWLQKQPEFAQSVKRGRVLADGAVARGLYSRAVGYSYETTRVVFNRGEPVVLRQTVHKPPDVRAAIFWLRNRRPQQWRDGARPARGRRPSKRVVPTKQTAGAAATRLLRPWRALLHAPNRRAAHRPGRAWPNQTAALVPTGKAMRAWLRARPRRMMADARWAVIRKGMGKGALAVMRLTTKPGQMTLTPMPSFFST